MYKLMIIDDGWERRSHVYLQVLENHFDIIPIINASDLFEYIETKKVDAYLIDIVLSEWIYNRTPLKLLTVLENIKNDKPIILVSNEYENLVRKEELTPLINAIIDRDYNVNTFLVWSDFVSASKKKEINDAATLPSKIKIDILKYRKNVIIKGQKQYDFAVICALGEELKPFIEKFTFESEEIENIHIFKSTVITKSKKQMRFLALQQEEMGNTDTAIIISKIISCYDIKHIFMIGVCGGREKKVKIGDIIIPHEVVAYQNGKITENGFMINVGYAKSKGNIKPAIQNHSDTILQKIFESYVKNQAKKGASINVKKPDIKFDEMASGAVVIDKVGELDRIAKETNKPKLCAVDMESFAMFRVCEILNIKASVIKSVMDLSSEKSDKYKEYASFISANYLYEILYNDVLSL